MKKSNVEPLPKDAPVCLMIGTKNRGYYRKIRHGTHACAVTITKTAIIAAFCFPTYSLPGRPQRVLQLQLAVVLGGLELVRLPEFRRIALGLH